MYEAAHRTVRCAAFLVPSLRGRGDRFGNDIYLTDERWDHIVDGHPEMIGYEDALRDTIRSGQRKQEQLAPQKFRYTKAFGELPMDNTHVVAVVLFRFERG